MTPSASPRVAAYAVLTAAGLLGALALRRPELVVLVAPFLLALALGLRTAREPRLGVSLAVARERALVGDEVEVELDVSTDVPVERLELLLVMPDGLEVASGENPVAVRLGRDESRTAAFTLRGVHWGSYVLGDVRVRARGRFGLVAWERRLDRTTHLRVYPRPEALRRLVAPVATQPFSGNDVARQKGEGLEFADLRLFAPGDRVRSINWRASARRDVLVVNERHPERNTDVILFVDSFAEARLGTRSTLDLAVGAAATIATRYLERRDRVGVVAFGGILRWLVPGTGLAQRYRIVDTLLETEVVFNYAWKDVSVIPARTLPPQALVVALTPLLDERSVSALLDLRARGYDLVVVEVSPVPFAEPGSGELEQLAYRLWLLHRQELRSRYESLGVAVAPWGDDVALEAALEGVRSFRRHARLARA
ncbi:MAG TPA: DUF58 domain-containing protein [Gaiellaceae bacterium]|nr:DUF58 domain-containing protein [Gaiellaceae bacterium]